MVTQCVATLGAKTSSGTYYATLCKVGEEHRIHVFELRAMTGELLTIVVDERGNHTPPELLDRAERVLADDRELRARERKVWQEARARGDGAALPGEPPLCASCQEAPAEGTIAGRPACGPCAWAATHPSP